MTVVAFKKAKLRWIVVLLILTTSATYLLIPKSETIIEHQENVNDEQLETPTKATDVYDVALEPIPMDERHDKWIVVTSITRPSKDVAKLAAIDGWRLVVVGDMKTPANWSHPGVKYLSVDEQMTLPYRLLANIPYNSYTRKVIGYLYAIQRGAEFIYDTDDDNHPTNGRIDFHTGDSMTGLVYRDTKYSVMNPYAHFGQPSIWPRGYPLESINTPTNNTYTLCTLRTPAIQQGLVNKDPDVDAIFRLVKKKAPGAQFNITFDSRAPPFVLPVGVFAPFNSQNTLFTYEALWALALPTSVSFRVTDIWRGYWAQRLLWLLGHKMAFYPPNAIQVRNPHDYLNDFKEEIQVYSDSGRLIAFLTQWNCEQNVSSFFQCVSKLSHDMVVERFWLEQDAIFTDLWLDDLNRIGYVEPSMLHGTLNDDQNSNVCDVTVGGIRTVYFSPVIQIERPPKRSDRAEKLIEFCGLDKLLPPIMAPNATSDKLSQLEFGGFGKPLRPRQTPKFRHDSILLIIVFNRGFYEVIPMLDNLYNDHFPYIAYCGETSNYERIASSMKVTQDKYGWLKRPEGITFINITSEKGYFSHECVMRAIEMNYSVDGYFVIGDDVLFNFWNLNLNVNLAAYETLTYGHFPRNRSTTTNGTWYFWTLDVGHNATNKALDDLDLQLRQSGDPLLVEYFVNIYAKRLNDSAAIDYTDLYYVPSSKSRVFQRVINIFYKHRVFVEFAIPMTIHGLHPTVLGDLFGVSLEREARHNWTIKYNPSDHYLHPVKLKDVMINPMSRAMYCKTYAKELLRKVYAWPG